MTRFPRLVLPIGKMQSSDLRYTNNQQPMNSANSAHTDTASKAAGLLDRFEDGTTLLMLYIALEVCSPIENLNKALQAESATLNGMLRAAERTLAELQRMRKVEAFEAFFKDCNKTARRLGLELTVPRPRRPPARFTGHAAAYHAATPEEHYRALYFVILDNAAEQLRSRFNRKAPGVSHYIKLEKMLLQGAKSTEAATDVADDDIVTDDDADPEDVTYVGASRNDDVGTDDDIVKKYPELEKCSLKLQLAMFHSQFRYTTLEQARVHMQNMCPEVRALFKQVEQLLRLVLVCPASSCTAERSFSALRRLKTWLRNTMTQTRLNSLSICHVHQVYLDNVDLWKVAAEFSGRSEIRRNKFGSFSDY
jgi:hAT family C-terminal dimerisation region